MSKNFLKSLLVHPEVRSADIDDPETVLSHARIIRQKSFLRQVYKEWYRSLRSALPLDVPGAVVELGSGGGFIREIIPVAITSDVQPTVGNCMVLDAARLPFRTESLKAILMVDVLHHLPRVVDFFQEASRCVKSEGIIAMIEPWNTMVSRFFYRHFHSELFNPEAENWHFAKGGPMSHSNQALPWILFQRDRARFLERFPQWYIVQISLHTTFCYVLSGGVSYRSFVPARTFRMWRRLENYLSSWMPKTAFFAKIVLKKKYTRDEDRA